MLTPFEVLFEAEVPDYPLPFVLQRLYGKLGFGAPVVYSNFVSSLDGVVNLGSGHSAGSVISGKDPADRFLMGLLRACADAVLIGAGTLRATPGHLWTPAHVFPDLAAGFTALRSGLGRSHEPNLVVVTSSGDMDVTHPALVKGATVITTRSGARAIGGRLPAACEVVALGAGHSLDIGRAVAELRERGMQVLLTEGGPHVMGQLVGAKVIDEMFLTLSPVLAGRQSKPRSVPRLGLVEGIELLPSAGVWSRLLSARRHGDHLFLRYALKR